MPEPTSSLSRVDFDRLIERAIKFDDEGNERIDLARARAIAEELGISAPAWEAALRERELTATVRAALGAKLRFRKRTSVIALVGLVAGALTGGFANQLADGVLLAGGIAVAAAAAILVDGIRRQRSLRNTQVELAAWWLSLPTGILLGMGELHPDPALLASVAWAGSAALGFALDRFIHRAPSPPPVAETSIA